jgi:hypothetical protein
MSAAVEIGERINVKDDIERRIKSSKTTALHCLLDAVRALDRDDFHSAQKLVDDALWLLKRGESAYEELWTLAEGTVRGE